MGFPSASRRRSDRNTKQLISPDEEHPLQRVTVPVSEMCVLPLQMESRRACAGPPPALITAGEMFPSSMSQICLSAMQKNIMSR